MSVRHMALFQAKVAKVGGNRLGVYLPPDICRILDIQHGDAFTFTNPEKPGEDVLSMHCHINRQVRAKELAMVAGSIDEIARRCAEAFFSALKVTPFTPGDEQAYLIFENISDAWRAVCDTLTSDGCPWSTYHEDGCLNSEYTCQSCKRDYVNAYASLDCTMGCEWNEDGQGVVLVSTPDGSQVSDNVVMCCKSPNKNLEPLDPADCDGEYCGMFDLDYEGLRKPFWEKFNALIATQLGDDWRERYCGT